MWQAFYQNWGKSCLASAFFMFVILFSSLPQLDYVVFLVWLQVPIYLLHEFEEHAYPGYPGHFKAFINQQVFKSKIANFPLNDANIFWINIPFIWIMFPIFAILAQHSNIHLGIILPAFALFNATTHIIAFCVLRRYNPGLVVSVLLNYPTGIYTLYVMQQAGLLDAATITLGILVAFIGHACMFGAIFTYFKRDIPTAVK